AVRGVQPGRCHHRSALRGNGARARYHAQARADDGRRCDSGKRAGQGFGLHPPPAGRRAALIKGSGGKRPAAPRLDSEQFRSFPRTCGRFRGILNLRKLAQRVPGGGPMLDTRRRHFITLLGGAAVAWPIAARAQQAGKLPIIGFLGPNTRSAASEWVVALVQRLRELGWMEGRTITIEYRWAEGREERFPEIAAELVRLKVELIVTSGTPAVMASKKATSVIPIVFATAGDPVGSGLVASLARPGGNVTGLATLANELAGKRLELLREVVPGLRRLAIMG